MKKYFDDFKKRVKKIAFTDSVHNLELHNVNSTNRRWMSAVIILINNDYFLFTSGIIPIIILLINYDYLLFPVQNARNWVTCPEPLDTEVKTKHGDVPRVSAGYYDSYYIIITGTSLFQASEIQLKAHQAHTHGLIGSVYIKNIP